VHPLERTGKWATILNIARFKSNPNVRFEPIPFNKTNVGLILKKIKTKDRRVAAVPKKIQEIHEKYDKLIPKPLSVPFDEKTHQLLKKTKMEINRILSKPYVAKRRRLVNRAFYESYRYRKQLNEKAQAQGFVPLEIHTHPVNMFLIGCPNQYRRLGNALIQHMKSKGYNVFLHSKEAVHTRKIGSNITFEVPGKMKPTRLSRKLEEIAPRCIKEGAIGETWDSYSCTSTLENLRKAKSFIRDALDFLSKYEYKYPLVIDQRY
jgi:hypothetical protein